jgi:DNA polymerase V
MYQPEVYYQKAGVMLSELVPYAGQQTDLFAYSSSRNKSAKLMDIVDNINSKYRRVPFT